MKKIQKIGNWGEKIITWTKSIQEAGMYESKQGMNIEYRVKVEGRETEV